MDTSMLRKDLQNYQSASNLSYNEKIKAEIARGVDVAHLAFGESPFPVPEPFVEGLRDSARRHEYLPSAGLPSLRHAILDFHRDWDGLNHFSAEHMLIAPGSKEAIYLLINVFGGEIILVSPAWITYEPQTQLGATKRHIITTTVTDGYKLPPQRLRETVQKECARDAWKLMIFNDPNNPSGQCYTETELEELAKVCREEKIIVLADEIYGRLKFGEKGVSMGKVYPEGTVITSGFSKWASAGGWRLGYALFPSSLAALAAAVQSAGSHTFTCAPTPIQHAVAKGLAQKDRLKTYIRESQRILSMVAGYIHGRLREVNIPVLPSQGGYYMMPDFGPLRAGLEAVGVRTGEEMCEAILREARVALMPCDPFNLQPKGELTTRLCFIFFDGSLAMEALARNPHVADEKAFVEEFCQPIVKGIQRLCDWVRKYQPSA